MIVCHCNVLTESQIITALSQNPLDLPNSPVQVYKCMGCKPNCGRCMPEVRRLLEEAKINACAVGCATCPAANLAVANDKTLQRVWLRGVKLPA